MFKNKDLFKQKYILLFLQKEKTHNDGLRSI